MLKLKKRDIATSITTFTFIIISITGSMMFFHILDAYTKSLNEILGLAFVLFAATHIFFNWKSMKNYFKKKTFISIALVTLVISLGFIADSANNTKKQHPSQIVVNSVVNAPLNEAIALLSKDVKSVNQRLLSSGVEFKNLNSIKEISEKNTIHVYKVIQLISG
jgi:hypothetical protein